MDRKDRNLAVMKHAQVKINSTNEGPGQFHVMINFGKDVKKVV